MSNLEFTPPKYVQIVHTIQERITDGTYAPGEILPSEARLVREFGAGRSTVVRALQILTMQGWIGREHGRGSFVKGVPGAATERFHAGGNAFDAAENATDTTITHAGRATAPAPIAQALGVPPESPAILRQRLINDENGPSELVSLWFPLDVAEGTDLHTPEPITIGAKGHLHTVKQVRPARIIERLSSRRPSDHESTQLQLGGEPPVLGVMATVLDPSDAVITVIEVCLPGDLHELEDHYRAT